MEIVYVLAAIATIGGLAYQVVNEQKKKQREDEAELRRLQNQHQKEEDQRKAELASQRARENEVLKSFTSPAFTATATPPIEVSTIEVLVLGRPGVGKTQLIWTLQGRSDEPAPTGGLKQEEFNRVTQKGNKRFVHIYIVPDIGGDDQFLHVVAGELRRRRPKGLIIMLDHHPRLAGELSQARIEDHMRALYSWLPILGEPNFPCETVLLLINKRDLWSGMYTEQQMRQTFSEYITKLEAAGLQVLVHFVSATSGAFLNQALADFERALAGA